MGTRAIKVLISLERLYKFLLKQEVQCTDVVSTCPWNIVCDTLCVCKLSWQLFKTQSCEIDFFRSLMVPQLRNGTFFRNLMGGEICLVQFSIILSMFVTTYLALLILQKYSNFEKNETHVFSYALINVRNRKCIQIWLPVSYVGSCPLLNTRKY